MIVVVPLATQEITWSGHKWGSSLSLWPSPWGQTAVLSRNPSVRASLYVHKNLFPFLPEFLRPAGITLISVASNKRPHISLRQPLNWILKCTGKGPLFSLLKWPCSTPYWCKRLLLASDGSNITAAIATGWPLPPASLHGSRWEPHIVGGSAGVFSHMIGWHKADGTRRFHPLLFSEMYYAHIIERVPFVLSMSTQLPFCLSHQAACFQLLIFK